MASAWKNEKRRIKDIEEAQRYEAHMAEQARREAISMFDRIEEAELTGDLKDILHRMAQHIGMEQ